MYLRACLSLYLLTCIPFFRLHFMLATPHGVPICLPPLLLSFRPDFAIAHGNIASCHFDMGNMEKAIRSYKHAIQLEPNFPDAYNNLGNAQRELGKLEEAVDCYREFGSHLLFSSLSLSFRSCLFSHHQFRSEFLFVYLTQFGHLSLKLLNLFLFTTPPQSEPNRTDLMAIYLYIHSIYLSIYLSTIYTSISFIPSDLILLIVCLSISPSNVTI